MIRAFYFKRLLIRVKDNIELLLFKNFFELYVNFYKYVFITFYMFLDFCFIHDQIYCFPQFDFFSFLKLLTLGFAIFFNILFLIY